MSLCSRAPGGSTAGHGAAVRRSCPRIECIWCWKKERGGFVSSSSNDVTPPYLIAAAAVHAHQGTCCSLYYLLSAGREWWASLQTYIIRILFYLSNVWERQTEISCWWWPHKLGMDNTGKSILGILAGCKMIGYPKLRSIWKMLKTN